MSQAAGKKRDRGGGGKKKKKAAAPDVFSGSGPLKPEDLAQKRNELEAAEIEKLDARIREESPAAGSFSKAVKFLDLPLSQYTYTALASGGFRKMTPIQQAAIPHALAGRDVLGAAKTGSGKTLAFVVPSLERLYRSKAEPGSGLGVLIITPTRELAVQIFDVIRVAGKRHSFSAGLVLGGKDLAEERRRVPLMNLLVATPGRLLQHCEQTAGFECGGVEVLVLDEADRILDMGFRKQIDSIMEYLPGPAAAAEEAGGEGDEGEEGGGAGSAGLGGGGRARGRQTLLFSATQTKSVRALARLSLRDPEYVAVGQTDEHVTPAGLDQKYVVTAQASKIDLLWSFLRSHLKSRVVVFFSTCRVVRFVHEAMCKMRPGLPLMALHGGIKQLRRTAIFLDYTQKPNAALFATDVAARGLDFPQVDWVVQFDCPEDEAMYIHRVGRTARYNKHGKALLFLAPREEAGMVKRLTKARVPIAKTRINPKQSATSTAARLEALCAQHPDLKLAAQKALKSYVRSVLLMPDKETFDASAIDGDAYAASLGLPKCPKLRCLSDAKQGSRTAVRAVKNQNRELQQLKYEMDAMGSGSDDGGGGAGAGAGAGAGGGAGGGGGGGSSSSDDEAGDGLLGGAGAGSDSEDFMVVKRTIAAGGDEEDEDEDEDLSLTREQLQERRKRKKRRKIDVDASAASKVTFDEDGVAVPFATFVEAGDAKVASTSHTAEELKAKAEAHARAIADSLRGTDADDRTAQRERLRAKRLKQKLKQKRRAAGGEDGEGGEGGMPVVAVLGGSDDSDDDDSDGGSRAGGGSSGSSSSSSDSDSDTGAGVQDQEALALQMMRARRGR